MIPVFVQASSVAWSGGGDLCMNPIEGKPAVYWTCKKYLDSHSEIKIIIIAPEFDRGGRLETLKDSDLGERVDIFYGSNESPLKRMVEACDFIPNSTHFIRVDGLHFPSDSSIALKMFQTATQDNLDCIKFPDDFPIQFSADIYKIEALKLLAKKEIPAELHIHPKYLLMSDDDFKGKYCTPPQYSDEFLLKCREKAKSVYFEPRLDVNEKKIIAGDQLSFHYEKAVEFISSDDDILDIACGNGYGSRLMAKTAKSVIGCDLEPDVVRDAQMRTKGLENLTYFPQDVTKMEFPDEKFDMVVSMETIEHVDDIAFVRETHRVLRKGGKLLISTPQNSLGHIPVNAEHEREYKIDNLKALLDPYFEVEKIIGIKQGRIVIDNSPFGTNVMILSRKK